MHDYLVRQGTTPPTLVGSASIADPSSQLANSIRSALGMSTRKQCSCSDSLAAFNYWTSSVEALGVCVCREGKVDLEEVRGIALTDEYAPFIYVNSNDSYAGRQFTLLHELVHLWINEPGLSNLAGIQKKPSSPSAATEVFCNKTAALILVPSTDFKTAWERRDRDDILDKQIEVIAKQFKVSEETIARRLLDNDVISQPEYERLRVYYRERWREHREQRSPGGDYYRNTLAFNSRLFTRTVLSARYSGQITVREACLTLGVKANHLKRFAETAGLFPAHQGGGDR